MPGSATTVGEILGLPRQVVNYHVRALERAGLVEQVARRQRRGLEERVVRATAPYYLIAPDALTDRRDDSGDVADRNSASYQVAIAARTIREVAALGELATGAGKRLTTTTLDSEVILATPADREAFARDLVGAVTDVIARYHSPDAAGGRGYRVFAGLHPRPVEEKAPPRRARREDAKGDSHLLRGDSHLSGGSPRHPNRGQDLLLRAPGRVGDFDDVVAGREGGERGVRGQPMLAVGVLLVRRLHRNLKRLTGAIEQPPRADDGLRGNGQLEPQPLRATETKIGGGLDAIACRETAPEQQGLNRGGLETCALRQRFAAVSSGHAHPNVDRGARGLHRHLDQKRALTRLDRSRDARRRAPRQIDDGRAAPRKLLHRSQYFPGDPQRSHGTAGIGAHRHGVHAESLFVAHPAERCEGRRGGPHAVGNRRGRGRTRGADFLGGRGAQPRRARTATPGRFTRTVMRRKPPSSLVLVE